VNTIFTVPAFTPVTTPLLSTVAMVGSSDFHALLAAGAVLVPNAVVALIHPSAVPLILGATGLAVAMANSPPPVKSLMTI